MDPRLEFAFQLLMDATGLPRHDVMDHVFEGGMLDEINQLFLPHMRATLIWYYQVVEEPEPQRSTDTVYYITHISLYTFTNSPRVINHRYIIILMQPGRVYVGVGTRRRLT